MKLLADLHTHSKNSRFRHGKNSIEEMAIAANEMGLVEIAITDHGYAHVFRTDKQKLIEARKVVDEINKWSKTKVLLGIEANIIKEDGTLDIDAETLSMLDILVISYHRMTITDFANYFGFAKKTEVAKKRCTNAFVNAINKYPVSMVAHLDSILTTDLYEIGKACRERGTMVEINNRHTKWTDKQVQDLIDSGCMFAVSSDAHSREMVGEVDKAFEYIRKYNIPSERVVNVEFSESEKSELDRRFTAYESLYEQLAKTKKDREDVIETRRRTEITGKLSTEMEDELRKIAGEKGLEYKEYNYETVEDGYMKNMSKEDLELARQAQEYIMQKDIENEQAANGNRFEQEERQEEYKFEDNHPLMRGVGSFETKFQSLNQVIENEELAENNDEFGDVNQAVAEKSENSSIFEKFSTSSNKVQEFKEIISEGKPETEVSAQKTQARQVFKKVEPENFMDSITQTKLVAGAKPIEVKPLEEEVKKGETKKPASQKGGRKGFFIAVNSLVDDDKK